jgi:transmembrane sensor
MTDMRDERRHDPIRLEGLEYILRRDSGEAAAADHAAFAEWRSRSAEHEAAARRAERMSALARSVGQSLAVEKPKSGVVPIFGRPVSRRTMLVGSVAASAAAVVVIGAQPLLFGPKADFETSKGERRVLALGDGLRMTLDSQSSADVVRGAQGARIVLLRGRAGIEAALAQNAVVEVQAGAGIARARRARYDIRLDGEQGCLTCLAGTVTLAHGERSLALGAGDEVRYDNTEMFAPQRVDADSASAWRRGMLVFHSAPLADVVREVNRYRAGRVVIARSGIAGKPVSGVFYLDSIDEAVGQIEAISGARALSLPGGLVMLT